MCVSALQALGVLRQHPTPCLQLSLHLVGCVCLRQYSKALRAGP